MAAKKILLKNKSAKKAAKKPVQTSVENTVTPAVRKAAAAKSTTAKKPKAKKPAAKKATAKAGAEPKALAKTKARRGKAPRIVVFGASPVAVSSLQALDDAGLAPELIVSQRVMDTETWKRTRTSPVSRWAKSHGHAIVLPEDGSSEDWLAPLLENPPDLVLTIGWSSPLPREILDVPRLGCIGIHTSNLPKHRGANPLRAAIAAGDNASGVTVYRIEGSEWDGPILLNEQMDIGPDDVYGDLAPRMAELSSSLVVEVVEKLAAGRKFQEKKQDDKRSSTTSRIDRRHRRAPWWLTAKEVYDRLRAYSPEPGLETFIGAKRMEILSGKPMDWMRPTFGDTGTYLGLRNGRLAVLCTQSTVFGIDRLRLIGGEAMSAGNYARDSGLSVGTGLV